METDPKYADNFFEDFLNHDLASPSPDVYLHNLYISLSALNPVILVESTFHSMTTLYIQGNIILLTHLSSSVLTAISRMTCAIGPVSQFYIIILTAVKYQI